MYHVIVKSLYEGEVPIQLKCANIVPLVKDSKANKHIYKNYRPISVTSVVARIIEKFLKKRIVNKINEEKIIPHYQYGGIKTAPLMIFVIFGLKFNIIQINILI